jgi:dolichol-phosphate mannosyltransferase
MKAIVVIPTYNESKNIIRIIDKIFSVHNEIDILVVDDNSPDGTGKLVKNKMEESNRIHIIERQGKMGLGTAYLAGFKYALDHGYDYIMEMDADFSHNPEEIPNFLKYIEEYDVVLGSRYIKGVNVVNWPLKRLLLSYFANLYTRIITGMDVKDATGGFKCFRATALSKINFDEVKSNGYSFQIEMTYRLWKKGAKVKEIPIIFVDRLEGESKMSKKIVYEAIFMVWKLKLGLVKISK